MKHVDRIYFALSEIEGKSVVTIASADWARLVRPDGALTELEQLPNGLNNPSLTASTLAAYASGIVVPTPGMDVLRYDPQDAPYVINLDHYTIIENLHLHPIYPDALRVAGASDTAELRWELQNNVYVIKEPPAPSGHWLTDFPKYIDIAKKRQ